MALAIAKRTARGALILFASNFTATCVSVVAMIIIARLLGPTGYGNYSLALVIPSILQLFIGFGALPAVVGDISRLLRGLDGWYLSGA